MPPKKRSRANTSRLKPKCKHTSTLTNPSPFATEAGYVWPSPTQRASAQGVKLESLTERQLMFPAPLVLPNDELYLNPKYPAQSFPSWTRAKYRNKVKMQRRTIYIVESPSIDPAVDFVTSWTQPLDEKDTPIAHDPPPDIQQLSEYVQAFYHPLPVELLPKSSYKFVPWSSAHVKALKDGSAPTGVTSQALLGLQTPQEIVALRTRPISSTSYSHQFNLNDLLDAAISSLPEDAYALLMLVDHDLYEDEDDEFVCGRAYGGSRVAVVSTARYNPVLDTNIELDLDHVWPMSHCAAFMTGSKPKKAKKATTSSKVDSAASTGSQTTTQPEPLHAAIDAVQTFRENNTASEAATALWLSRLCRTTTHELGHCFGMDHCVYYACCMQGSASILEDHRQPPYPCPVDLAKVLEATSATEKEWLGAMLAFCERAEKAEMFIGLGAWARQRLRDIDVRT